LHTQAVAAGLVPPDYWLRYVQSDTRERLSFLVADAESRARGAYRKFYLRPSKFGTVVRHAAGRRFWSVASGLGSLMRSSTNAVRDM
jgi:hypothetical protein